MSNSRNLSYVKHAILSFLIAVFFASGNLVAQDMTVSDLGKYILEETQNRTGEYGAWQFIYGDRVLLVMTDSVANRMRIFSPIVEETELEKDQLRKMLEANFHSALDAKYSLYTGFVVAVYTHPLRELTKDQFIDALRQVVVLSDTFGTTYQSTGLIFGGGFEEKETPKRTNVKPSKKT